MPREVEPSINEREFVLKALTEEQRLDGRKFDQYRDIELTFGDEYGVADVRLGKTRVLANISAQVTAPFPDRPFDGLFTITTELSPMASPSFESGRPGSQEVSLSRLLEKTLRRSQALDTESLCLIAAQKVWSIRADVHVLSHDGNLVDASCIAVLAALQHFKRNDTSIEGESVTVYTPAERAPVPLSILHQPFCVTFASFHPAVQGTSSHRAEAEEEELVLLDPTALEEKLADGSVTISLNRHQEICQIAKGGGVPIDALTLLNCAMVAGERVKAVDKLVKEKLKEDEGRRSAGKELLNSANAR